jgi:hypothetical protein
MTDELQKGQLIVEGLYVNFIADGKIMICTIESLSRVVVDAWIEHCDQEMQRCVAENRPILVLQDLSQSSEAQTPYSKERGQVLTNAYPELDGRTAFVLPDTPDNQRIRLFVRRQPHHYGERRIFFTRQEALDWLKQGLKG